MSELTLEENNNYWLRNVILITISQFFTQVAFCSAMTFIPFYFKELGIVDKSSLSLHVAFYNTAGNLSFCLFAPVWGVLGDRYGRKLMLLRANFGGAVLTPLMALITSPALLIGHRMLLGALVGTVTAAQTLVVTTTPQKKRTIALGMISAGLFSGLMGGQFIGGLAVSHLGFATTFVGSGLLLLIGSILLCFTKENFHRPSLRAKKKPIIQFRMPRFGKSGLLLLLFVALGFTRDIDAPFLPQLVMDIMDDSPDALLWTGWINGVCALGGMLSGLILGFAASKWPMLKILTIVFIVGAVMRFMQAFAPSPEILMAERFVQILSSGGMEPMFQAWLAGVTLPSIHGKMLGWSATSRSTGWMIGVMTGGFLAVLFGGVRNLFVVAALLYLMLIPLMFAVAKRTPPPPAGARK